MKKLNLNWGEGGPKQALLRHVEKIVLGMALLLGCLLVYSGSQREGLPKDQTPKRLDGLSTQAVSHINQVNPETWDAEIQPERRPTSGYEKRVSDSRRPTNHVAYANPLPWNPPIHRQYAKRGDPQLYKPIKIETYALTAAVAYDNARGTLEDPLADEPPATLDEEEETRPGRRPSRRQQGDDLYGGEYPGMDEGSGTAGRRRGRTGRGGSDGESSAFPPQSGTARPGSAAPPGSGGMLGGGTYGAGGPGAVRQVNPDLIEGYRPGGGGGYGGAGGAARAGGGGGGRRMGTGGGSDASTVARTHHIVAIKAVFPFEKQWNEFERVFMTAKGYDPQRDTPRPLYAYVERAEVRDDPEAPLDWKEINSTGRARKMARLWEGVPEELADFDYVDEALTMEVPPVMLHPLEPLALHSDVPRETFTDGELDEELWDDDLDPMADPGDDLPDAVLDGGRDGAYGGEMAPGMRGGRAARGQSRQRGMPPGTGRGPRAGAARGMGGSGYGGGRGMEGGYGEQQGPLVQYKLIRFFDFDVEPGKKYRYRLQVMLEDPNRPQDSSLAPSPQSLTDDVLTRIKNVEAQEAKDPSKRRRFYVRSEWSDPSDVVTIPPTEKLLASTVTPARFIDTEDARIHRSDPSGNVLAVVWDKLRAVHVPVEQEIFRGSLLNLQRDADVLHPVTLEFKRLKDYALRTNALVIDIRGGDELPGGDRKNPLQGPGEVAFIDGQGNLVVRNELDDVDDYRKLTFADDSEQAAEEGTMPGYEGMQGMPPMGGGLFEDAGAPGRGRRGAGP